MKLSAGEAVDAEFIAHARGFYAGEEEDVHKAWFKKTFQVRCLSLCGRIRLAVWFDSSVCKAWQQSMLCSCMLCAVHLQWSNVPLQQDS